MSMRNKILKNAYNMRLASGQCLSLVATPKMRPWLARFASIMELSPSSSEGNPKVIFARYDPLRNKKTGPGCDIGPVAGRSFPVDGWSLNDLRVVKIWHHDLIRDVVCEIPEFEDEKMEILQMCNSLYAVYNEAQKAGGFPMHAALIERRGRGIVVAAPGNTGKSTLCRRLPPRWKALSDDEALIVPDIEGRYLAHPFPTWSDYIWNKSENTWNVERSVFLEAIFFLEQAEVNEVEAVDKVNAVTIMNRSVHEVFFKNCADKKEVKETPRRRILFENVCRAARVVRSFRLRCTLSGELWDEIDRAIGAGEGRLA